MKLHSFSGIAALLAMIATASGNNDAQACTRVVYAGDSVTATGRTLDWRSKIPTSLRVFPRGEHHISFDDPNDNIVWTSKYATIMAVSYNMGFTEGMNEKGLAANVLYLPGSVYSYGPGKEHRKKMSSSVWPQYVLDNFATVDEAVKVLSEDEFYIYAPAMPDGSAATLHMAISDTSGNCAVIEYKMGKLEITTGPQYNVLTNAPFFEQQLAVCDYWQSVGGMHMLPGTNRSSDRFARAAFYASLLPKNLSHRDGLAGVFGVIRNCAVPMGISIPDQPEISSTQWFSLCDQTDKVYYFQLTQSPGVVWVNLTKLNIAEGAPQLVVSLTTDGSQIGNINALMRPAAPFKPAFHL